jgi:hypothetical protein
MMTPSGFDSWKGFGSFALAREFGDQKTKNIYLSHSTRLEEIGDALSSVVMKPIDAVMRGFRNPLVIVALTVSLIFIASLVFYPVQAMAAACRILPFLKHVNAAHVKAALFGVSQAVILGLGLRTVGRLSNDDLKDKVRNGRVFPIPVGAVPIN